MDNSPVIHLIHQTHIGRLALLWYHTIVRPFFALDGSNVQAGVEAAQNLIRESQPDFGQSALFLFFKGRVERLKVRWCRFEQGISLKGLKQTTDW